MFILVNYPAEYGIGDGISEIGRYDTRKEAATKIAEEIINYYGIDIDIDDFIKEERQCDNGDFRYDDDADNHVWFNNYECSCYGQNMEDSWLIIEV